ncbi:acyl carrier protein [Nocardia sp. NBC_01503]|uniref:acyl carrier protein n=1 Tax=Nocardia sp. NBC_01503 TaxID=2975997 RepID=UPI002E7ABB71|nr:acyl carrier protein [Nocardia sp. NBC_01503]WTL29086.1 acyl carrier protein [Nocardia sp. NBC_01503]
MADSLSDRGFPGSAAASRPVDSAVWAAVVLTIVRGLVAEVHPHASRATVTLDSRFDDLGIGSVELAELLVRVRDASGVELASHLLTSAENPRDLVRAIDIGHVPVGEKGPVVSPSIGPAGGAAAVGPRR